MKKNGILLKSLPLLIILAWSTSCSSPRNAARHSSDRMYITKQRTQPIESLTTRDNIVKEAEKYIGIVYRYGGKHPKDGFDCSGFTTYVYQTLGIHLYGSSSTLAKKGKRKSMDDAKPGDLAFFGSKGKVTHVAIVLNNSGDDLEVIHCTSQRGVRKDEVFSSDYWREKYLFTKDVLN